MPTDPSALCASPAAMLLALSVAGEDSPPSCFLAPLLVEPKMTPSISDDQPSDHPMARAARAAGIERWSLSCPLLCPFSGGHLTLWALLVRLDSREALAEAARRFESDALPALAGAGWTAPGQGLAPLPAGFWPPADGRAEGIARLLAAQAEARQIGELARGASAARRPPAGRL
jgi:hypothetical protein